MAAGPSLLTRRALALGAAVALAACGDRGTSTALDPASGRAALAVRAAIQSTSATDVELHAGYLRTDGQRVEIGAQTVPLGDTPTQQATMALDVGRCLADAQRAVPGPACSLVIELRLMRGTTVLDVQTITTTVAPGQAASVASPTPLYEVKALTIGTAGATTPMTSARVELGDTLRLTATTVDATGAPLDGRVVAWTSTLSTIASVDASGAVAGRALGNAIIQASGGGRVTSLPVTVIPATVRTIDVTPSPLQLTPGATTQLTATPRDRLGRALTGRVLAYATSNPTVAVVSSAGLVQGVGPGFTTISVSSAEGPNGTTVRTDVPVTVGVAGNRGVVSGRLVVGATNAPVTNAAIRILSNGALYTAIGSASDGSFTTPALPAGTYTFDVSASGLLSTSIPVVVVNGDVAVPTIPLTLAGATTTGSVNVTLRDATTGLPITVPVTVTVVGGIALASGIVDGLAPKTTLTTSNGTLVVPSLTNTVTLRAQATGYADALAYVAPVAGQTLATTLALSPLGGAAGQMRIVLTWGANPSDLDSHLTGPATSTTRFHVYWAEPGLCTASPFVCLDVDETGGYGPETITIAQGQSGTYHYAVNLFSGSGTIATSNARVDVYAGGTLARTFTPPAGTGDWWNVFDIVNGQIVPVNTYGSTAPHLVAGALAPSKRPASLRRQP